MKNPTRRVKSGRRKPRRRKYETRLILFLDFLGFRQVVAKTMNDPSELERLVAAIDSLENIPTDKDAHKSLRITQFSDSLVVSYRVNEESAVFDLMNSMALTIIEIVERGYLVRGAVTIGDLYHTNKRLVGPAMVRAYEMESKEACVPRVIVDPSVLEVARRYRSAIHSPDDEESYVRAFLIEDDDKRLYFDYISWPSVVEIAGGDRDLYPSYLGRIGEMVEAGLQASDARVAKKYLWLHRHYLAAIELFEEIPANAEFRTAEPEICAAIESLPKLKSEAKAAAERIGTTDTA